jgi:hypothetical protein
MQAGCLSRRFVLLLPVVLAACGGEEEQVFEPLRFNYLPPIQLNVASIEVQQRFLPSGVAPDVSGQDPAPPIQVLTAMGNDRLQAFGTANKAVFAILDASLTRVGDAVDGSFAVSVTILDDSGTQLGFAEARIQTRRTGRIRDLRAVLYDVTKTMMSDPTGKSDMNIEFEYQIRKNLRPWLTSDTAPPTPVEQTPLGQPDAQQTQPALPPGVQPLGAQPWGAPSQPVE